MPLQLLVNILIFLSVGIESTQLHENLCLNSLGDASLEYHFGIQSGSHQTEFSDLETTLINNYLNNYDQVGLADFDVNNGFILLKGIKRTINTPLQSIHRKSEITKQEMSWDISISLSKDQQISVKQSNMYLEIVAMNEDGTEMTQIQSIEDDLSAIQLQLESKVNLLKEERTKEISKLKRELSRVEKKLKDAKRQNRIDKLTTSRDSKLKRLEKLENQTYQEAHIREELSTIMGKNLSFYFEEWAALKSLISK